MILVTGASGKTGRAVVRQLSSSGAQVRALVRREDQIAELLEDGAADVRVGDMAVLESVQSALSDCSAVYYICPNVHPAEVALGKVAIAAAESLGVERVVYHSVLQPQLEAMPHHWQKLRVEELLIRSRLDFTILQPAPYMQNLVVGWEQIATQGVYERPYSREARLSLVDIGDVAEVAALVLGESGHERAIYELCGCHWMDGDAIAEVLGHVLGRRVCAVVQSLDIWQQHAETLGIRGYRRQALLAMFRYYDLHGLGGSSTTLSRLLGRAPTQLADFVRRQAAVQS